MLIVNHYYRKRRISLDAAFKEAEHPREKAGPAAGQFTSTGGGGETAAPKQLKSTRQRAWEGGQKSGQKKLSKQEAGALGEEISIGYLKSLGFKDAMHVNSHLKNFPVDLIQDHELIEVKTGLVSNGSTAQQWRATIGQPGKAEIAWLKKASPEAKAIHNAKKKAAIMERKMKVMKEFEQKTGKKFKGRTLTLIIDPDTKTADIHMFEGFHHRIGWHSDEAKKGYVGSFNY